MDDFTLFMSFMAAFSSAVQIIFIKLYLDSNNSAYICLAILFALVLLYSYSMIASKKNITCVFFYLKFLSILIAAFLGYAIFNTKLNIRAMIGLFFGCIAMYLMSSEMDA